MMETLPLLASHRPDAIPIRAWWLCAQELTALDIRLRCAVARFELGANALEARDGFVPFLPAIQSHCLVKFAHEVRVRAHRCRALAEELIDAHRFVLTLHLHQIHLAHVDRMLGSLVGGL